MKSISAFLNPAKVENIKVAVSERFKDEEGKPILWEFRSVSNSEVNAINKRLAAKSEKVDVALVKKEIAVASLVYPDLHNAELQEGYAIYDPVVLLETMTIPGEIATIMHQAFEISGLNRDEKADQKELEEAKN